MSDKGWAEYDASQERAAIDCYGTPEHEAWLLECDRDEGDGWAERPTTEQLGGDTRPDPPEYLAECERIYQEQVARGLVEPFCPAEDF